MKVLVNPAQANGWWPSPHTNDEYAKFLTQDGASFFSVSPPSDVADAMNIVVGRAIQSGAVTEKDVTSATRYLVLTNYHGFGGQTNGVTPYVPRWVQGNSIRSVNISPTVAWANEDTTNDGALTVIQHELGHQLGLPDLYGGPCLLIPPGEPAQTAAKTTGDCINSWDPMGLSDSRNIGFGYFARLLMGWVNPYSPTTLTETSAFSGSISLSSIEYPDGDSVALHIPDNPNALILARAFGNSTFLNGFVAECRRTPSASPIAAWRNGLLISYVDSRQKAKQVIVRPRFTARGDTNNLSWTEWLLRPGDAWQNQMTNALVDFKGFDSKGGCSVDINVPGKQTSAPHFMPASDASSPSGTQWLGGNIPRSVYANPGLVVNGPRLPLPRSLKKSAATAAGAAASRKAVARTVASKRSIRVKPIVRGKNSLIRFAYGNAGAKGAGVATVRVEQPYVARPDCGKPGPAGRVIGRVKLRKLAAGAAGIGQLRWKPRSTAPAAISVSLLGAGEPAASAETSTTTVGFQTMSRKRGGRKAPSTTARIVLAVPRDCAGPRSFSVNPAIAPRGWSVKILGKQTAIRPGKRRVVRVRITAPKGSRSAATAVPIAITSVATASPLKGSATLLFNGRSEPQSAGGVDLLARVAKAGKSPPAFVLPAFAQKDPAKGAPPLNPLTGSPLAPQTVSISACSTQVVGSPTAVTVEGDLSPARSGIPVTLTYTPLSGPPPVAVTHTVLTDAAGHFVDQLEREGVDWNAVASVADDSEYAASQSAACHVPVP